MKQMHQMNLQKVLNPMSSKRIRVDEKKEYCPLIFQLISNRLLFNNLERYRKLALWTLRLENTLNMELISK
ncbi:hypothetical protein BpHYR1_022788 [Brachionus plicatilis]|uniref:Uncharacterized protein n=1 Tax=Brachionus plicatilis TaxID=10195 RepID=A0A3M7QLE2_BRAPC|nr:hypothetical protein BpHYR1_022788 [Brachionus plicatilis]